ncbi:MAG: LysR family transcriptional regulator [Pseudomonadota bacterium]
MTAISDLEIFARVARTGNMSAAGREMGLSPAVVSKRISLLEDRLGARLFQRTTRHLTLTETGEGYFRRVVDILSLVEEAEDFVSRRNTKPRGRLKATVPTAFSTKHIAPHLREFMDRYPEIDLDIHVTDEIVDIIRDGFDVAIRIGELQDSSLVAKKLAPNHRVLCATPDYLERRGIPQTLDDLELHNCIPLGSQDHWRLEDTEGQQYHLKIDSSLSSNSADFTREALLSGLGIGLRATWDVREELKSGKLRVILPEYRGSSNAAIFAVYPSRDFMPTKVNVFIDFLCELYGVEPSWDKGLDLPPFGKPQLNRDSKSGAGGREAKLAHSRASDIRRQSAPMDALSLHGHSSEL